MATIKFDYSPIEPAHPMHVKMQEHLLDIYKIIREQFQNKIDNVFDVVSSRIGFVLTTAVPVVLHFDNKGNIKDDIIIEGKQFKGTIFESALKETLSEMQKMQFPERISAGEYRIYIFWLDALKLKLRTDWIEPAHFRRFSQLERLAYMKATQSGYTEEAVKPDVQEPAHWFDPWVKLPVEELILVSVIDEIYPELRLIDKVRSFKDLARFRVRPDVMEPVHYYVRPELMEPAYYKVRPEVIEPVHQRIPVQDIQVDKLKGLLSQLGEMLRNYGF